MDKNESDITEEWAEWTSKKCPKCEALFVAMDRFGFYCCIDGCNWREDIKNGGKKWEPKRS